MNSQISGLINRLLDVTRHVAATSRTNEILRLVNEAGLTGKDFDNISAFQSPAAVAMSAVHVGARLNRPERKDFVDRLNAILSAYESRFTPAQIEGYQELSLGEDRAIG